MPYRNQAGGLSLQHRDTREGERRAAARGTLDRRARAYHVRTDYGWSVTDGIVTIRLNGLDQGSDVARAYARAHNIAYNHKD